MVFLLPSCTGFPTYTGSEQRVVRARVHETAALTCPFVFSHLQDMLEVYSVSWERAASEELWVSVETDPNMKRYLTQYSDSTASLLVPLGTEDLGTELMFRCVMQLTRCNDSRIHLCQVRSVSGPATIIIISGKERFC